MGLKILLADSDKLWLIKAKDFLAKHQYEVVIANDGKEVQLALYRENFFIIIINYDIQHHPCLQVLKFIKSNFTNQRVVIILNDKDTLLEENSSEEKLQKLDVAEILIRPFDLEYLKNMLEKYKSLRELIADVVKKDGISDEEEVTSDNLNFSSIKIDEFYSARYAFFDIYIKLSENKYLKILHTGDSFSKERIEKYRDEKKLERLYFHNSDRRKFIEYNNHVAKKVIGSKTVPVDKKINILNNVLEKYIEESYIIGVKPQIIEQGREICDSVYKLIEKQPNLFFLLKSLNEFDPTAYAHSFLVTLYSTAIIKQFEWQSQGTIETTAMACMFHDIGKTLLPKEFLNLRPKDMTFNQLELYKTHPELGLKVVENCRAINSSIKQIILQHHEAYDGSGFPNEIKGTKILALANIVCLVDDFVHIMIDEKLQPTDALCKILSDEDGVKRYSPIFLEKFIHIFADPKKVQKEITTNFTNPKVVPHKKISSFTD